MPLREVFALFEHKFNVQGHFQPKKGIFLEELNEMSIFHIAKFLAFIHDDGKLKRIEVNHI